VKVLKIIIGIFLVIFVALILPALYAMPMAFLFEHTGAFEIFEIPFAWISFFVSVSIGGYYFSHMWKNKNENIVDKAENSDTGPDAKITE
jgi:hypothetical protein